jgi:hypothetical protein
MGSEKYLRYSIRKHGEDAPQRNLSNNSREEFSSRD